MQFNVYCVGYLAKPVWLSDPVDGRVDIYVVNTDNGVCLLLFVCDQLKSAFPNQHTVYCLEGIPYILWKWRMVISTCFQPHIFGSKYVLTLVFYSFLEGKELCGIPKSHIN